MKYFDNLLGTLYWYRFFILAKSDKSMKQSFTAWSNVNIILGFSTISLQVNTNPWLEMTIHNIKASILWLSEK